MISPLKNQSITLAKCTVEDTLPIFNAIKNSYNEISPWATWLTTDYDFSHATAYVKLQIYNWQEKTEYAITIKDKDNNLLGFINLNVFDQANSVASIGYWMNSEYTGFGYCTQAVKLLVTNAIQHLKLFRIEIITAVNNLASQKVAINSGAKFECILKNRICLNGEASDAKIYAITPELK